MFAKPGKGHSEMNCMEEINDMECAIILKNEISAINSWNLMNSSIWCISFKVKDSYVEYHIENG